MNSILIVIPILTLLMFDLGLSLRGEDFALLLRRPRAVLVGVLGQIVLLPVCAYCLGLLLNLPPVFMIGFMLIACCPGGSSSNVFSKLAKGDVALSVSLTAISSLLTLLTMPVLMQTVASAFGRDVQIHLPVGNLLIQNLLTMLLPILIGLWIRHKWQQVALRISAVLSRLAFPLLMLLAALFFIGHRATIVEYFPLLGLGTTALLITCILLAFVLGAVFRLQKTERRTIVIEVGMQNAAQAIAVASSPFVFADETIAIPAIIYALMMNVVLLVYVAIVKYVKK